MVRRALAGMGAVAGGMIIATAIKLAATQRKRWRWMAFGALAFVAIALLRLNLVGVLAVLLPAAVVAAWVAGRAPRGDARS